MIVNLSIPSSKTSFMEKKKSDRKDILKFKEMKSKKVENKVNLSAAKLL